MKHYNNRVITSFIYCAICITVMINVIVPTKAEVTDERATCEACNTVRMSEDFNEMVDVKYNADGEIIEFSVPVTEEYYRQNVSKARVAGSTIISIVSGVCFVIEVVYDVSCADLARYIGLEFIDGLYKWQNQPYNGKWSVTYGYADGCQPMHSSGCFRATYTKIG